MCKTCCVCYESGKDITPWTFNCNTCKEGIMCYFCYHNYVDEKEIDANIEPVPCPICNQLNYKEVYSNCLNTLVDEICEWMDPNWVDAHPVFYTFLNNYREGMGDRVKKNVQKHIVGFMVFECVVNVIRKNGQKYVSKNRFK